MLSCERKLLFSILLVRLSVFRFWVCLVIGSMCLVMIIDCGEFGWLISMICGWVGGMVVVRFLVGIGLVGVC